MIILETLSAKYGKTTAVQAAVDPDIALELGILPEDLDLVRQCQSELQGLSDELFSELTKTSRKKLSR